MNREDIAGTDTERQIRDLERKLDAIRRRLDAHEEWERSRRPIRIGFRIVIPIVLSIEAVHLYWTFGRTQGGRAPWLMAGAILAVSALSIWYYRQAKVQRDKVLMGFSRARDAAVLIESRIEELRSRSGPATTMHVDDNNR